MRCAVSCVIGLVVVGLVARSAIAAPDASIVEIWAGSRATVQRVDVDSLALATVSHADVQSGGTWFCRGIPLGSLIAAYAPPASVDLALLHFANGMTVPLPFRDPRVMARLDPLIARAMSARRDGDLRPGTFPPLAGAPLGGEVSPEARNRLVVNERWHPDVSEHALAKFTPWQHVDTLVGIELVDGSAYYGRLDVSGSSAVRAGGRLFRESCQFCHAARGVGGNLGWDFIEPEPIYSDGWFRHFRSTSDDDSGYRDPATSLYAHATFRVPGSAGRLMPALRYLTPDDARSLWLWIRAIAAARPAAP
jgi:mono/diheme cytochrome c family protein